MLYKLVEEVCEEILAIDFEEDKREMAGQLRAARPDLYKNDPKQTELMAVLCIGAVKTLPNIVTRIHKKAVHRSTSASERCVLHTVLAYLVQPHDLIPDDTPGGYGYLDDFLLLRAMESEIVESLSKAERKKSRQQALGLIAMTMKRRLHPVFEEKLEELSLSLQTYKMYPAPILDTITQLLIQNPLDMPAMPQARMMPPPVRFPIPPLSMTPRGFAEKVGDTLFVPGVIADRTGVYPF